MCVFSSHVTFHTCTILMYVVVCLYVSHNSFPDFVRKRPRLHLECLVLREDRIWRMPLASPWDSLFVVNRRFLSAAWPQNETAELVQKALANFCGSDRRFPNAVRNRRSDLGDLIFLGLKRRSWSAVMKPPNETAEVPLFSREPILRFSSAAWPQNETADRRFQRAIVSFHMPSSWGL